MPDSASAVVLAQATRALDEQVKALGEARGRTSLVFALAGISASFFVGPVLDEHEGVPALAWVGIALLLASLSFALAVWWPVSITASASARTLTGPGWEILEVDELQRQLALVYDRRVDEQGQTIAQRQMLVLGSMVLAVLSVIPWIILLAKGP